MKTIELEALILSYTGGRFITLQASFSKLRTFMLSSNCASSADSNSLISSFVKLPITLIFVL